MVNTMFCILTIIQAIFFNSLNFQVIFCQQFQSFRMSFPLVLYAIFHLPFDFFLLCGPSCKALGYSCLRFCLFVFFSNQLKFPSFRAARKKEKVTEELQLHSDQGFQYTSQAYFNLTKSYGITPSMSRRGNPYDNAMAENFFSILKTECIYRTKLRTYEEARLLIGQYIHFYNNERIQLKTKLTPLEKRSQYVA